MQMDTMCPACAPMHFAPEQIADGQAFEHEPQLSLSLLRSTQALLQLTFGESHLTWHW
jgi:hypothetical protein